MRSRTIPTINNNNNDTTNIKKTKPIINRITSVNKANTTKKKVPIFFSLLFLWTIYYCLLSPRTTTSSFDRQQEQTDILDPREHFMVRRKSREYAVETYINDNKNEEKTIAYAISLTSCNDPLLVDGAAVLKHSVHLSSNQNPASGSKYNYKMFVIVHPQALECSTNLFKLGYEVLERDTPVDVTQIKGEFLRDHIVKSGCCQEKELIKLWAYTLTDYPVVVHLDIDTLVLQPMDELYDAIIYGPTTSSKENIKLMFQNTELPSKIEAYFTRDYNLVRPGKAHVGIQGGFFAARPSQAIFNEFLETILKGDFKPHSGWGALGYGGYYGAQQIQGLLPYFYDHLHPNTGVELNRCVYNTMVDNPYLKVDGVETDCKIPHEKQLDSDPSLPVPTVVCEDCRLKTMSQVKLVHFTICQKPWTCDYIKNVKTKDLCNPLHHEWFRIRKDMEVSWEMEHDGAFHGDRSGIMKPDHFLGFCTKGGQQGYIPVTLPSN